MGLASPTSRTARMAPESRADKGNATILPLGLVPLGDFSMDTADGCMRLY